MLLSRLRRVSVSVFAASLASTLLVEEASAQSASGNATAPANTASAAAVAPSSALPSGMTPLLPVGTDDKPRAEEPSTTEASTESAVSTDGTARGPQTEEFPVDPSSARSRSPRDEVVLKPPKQTRWLLIGAGLATTAAWYGAGYGIGALWPDAPGRNDLRIPVAGPFMDLAKTGCPAGESDCSTFELVVRTVLVSLDAVGQAGGIALMLEGALFSPSGIEPPRSSSTRNQLRQNKGTSVVAIPWSDGKSGAGIGLVGRF